MTTKRTHTDLFPLQPAVQFDLNESMRQISEQKNQLNLTNATTRVLNSFPDGTLAKYTLDRVDWQTLHNHFIIGEFNFIFF